MIYTDPVDNDGNEVANDDYNKNRPVVRVEGDGPVFFDIHASHQYPWLAIIKNLNWA